MVSIRRAEAQDIALMQACNLLNLPQNYQIKYYYYHLMSWPHLLYVAETDQKKIVGYVLAKIQDENGQQNHGHITSISVLATYRKMGIATKLMLATLQSMEQIYECEFCSLHVRVSNRSALGLYRDVLKFDVANTQVGYYADGENAYEMKKVLLQKKMKNNEIDEKKQKTSQKPDESKKQEELKEMPSQTTPPAPSQQSTEEQPQPDKKKKKKRKNKKNKKGQQQQNDDKVQQSSPQPQV